MVFMWNFRIPVKFIISALVLGAILLGWFTHESTQKRIIERNQTALSDQLKIRVGLIHRRLEKDRANVRFLYSTPPIQGIVRATQSNNIDPKDGTQLNQWKLRLETIFEGFLENNPSVSQARYIGVANDGMEMVRVDRQVGNVKVRRNAQLQQKGHRDYFKSISQLSENQVYVSEINLNRERGEIVIPYEPTYRVGVPVFDARQQLFGMVLLNIDARPLLESINSDLPTDVQLILLNSLGGFVSHPFVEYQFQHEIGGDANFVTEYLTGFDKSLKAEWLEHSVSDQVYFYKRATIPLAQGAERRFMDLILMYPQSSINRLLFEQSTLSLMIGAAVMFLVLLFLAVFQSNVNKNLRLLNTQAQFESIIEGSSDAIVAVDERRLITLWNTSAQDMLGYTTRHVEGQLLQQVLSINDNEDEFHKAMNMVMAGRHHQPVKLLLRKRNQTELHASVSLSPIMRSGKVVGAAAIFRDISSQIKAENQIREINSSLEDQVKERTFQLEEAKNEALSASKTKSSFIANVSHEIRTPLNGIIGMLNLIRKCNDPAQINRYLGLAGSSAETLSSLVNDVLDLSKIEAGSLDMDAAEYDLRQVLSTIVASLSVRAYEKRLELIVDTTLLEQPFLFGDASRVAQVFTNLISNAIKFTEAGWVRIKVRSEQNSNGDIVVHASVEDTGVGVAGSKLDDIFEAFSQEDNSVTRQFGGTGLGLSITRQLCQLMNGDVSVTSSKGMGSTFSFSVLQGVSRNPENRVETPDLKGKKIAVVGGSEILVQSISNQLYQWNAKSVDHFKVYPSDANNDSHFFDGFDSVLIDESMASSIDQMDRNSQCDTYVLMMHHMNSSSNVSNRTGIKKSIVKPVTVYELLSVFCEEEPANRHHKKYKVGHKENTEVLAPQIMGAKILLVDDNEINLEVAIGLLEDYGVFISVASNGKEALDVLKKSPQDLVLMDCQMPVMDGYTATQKIRQGICGEAVKSVPILAMTASAMAGDRERCSDSGMDDYMTKPLDPELLYSKLEFWFSKVRGVNHSASEDSGFSSVPSSAFLGELKQQPLLDRDALQKRVRYKLDRELHVIALFLEHVPAKLEELLAALDFVDAQAVGDLSHSIKGSAGNLGAMRMHFLCQKIESEAKLGNIATVQGFGVLLQSEFTELMSALNDIKRHAS